MTLYITQNGQQLGPYTLAEAQNLAAAGTLLPTDWAWYEGLTTWVPLQQVPGFASASAPAARAERPVLVWVICIFYFIGIPLGLLSAFVLMPLIISASSSLHIPEAQHQHIQSFRLSYFDYSVKALNYAILLTWAILLFRLNRLSLYFLLGSIALAAFKLIHTIIATDLIAVLGTTGFFVSTAIGWTFNFALLYYNWHLFRKGILR